ncbi:MAG: tRNA uridine-5-carboxymethylaminomethyl(34) synthesis enzyme MnmG [Oscillospiraceae bacterium]|nr:tRNA uridine-5-carboxymethylaminomethyl(34) synthesis enzyme MnmG [Oscillospiraceae bacterium]
MHYDIIIIGAGHAGIEAGLAAARLGCRTAIFTQCLDAVANLPCNPSIGGTSKGHIVREIDALGGEMGKVADETTIQFRMLNLGKGPAVHSPRAQVDRRAYADTMKLRLEQQPNLHLIQGEVISVEPISNKPPSSFLGKELSPRATEEGSRSDAACGSQLPNGLWPHARRDELCSPETINPPHWSIQLLTGATYTAQCVILATGTFLRARVHIGEHNHQAGPDGLPAAMQLSESLKQLGIPLQRFKTGTPPRVNRRSIDFSQTTEQPGDEHPTPFSFLHEARSSKPQLLPREGAPAAAGEEGSRSDVTSSSHLRRDDSPSASPLGEVRPQARWGCTAAPAVSHPPAPQVPCHLTFTTEATKQVIQANLHRSPMYSGVIDGIGARYCPSIEDKIVRFADKDRHNIFIEPCGRHTNEMYLQGLSSSLPEDVQHQILATVPGLQHAQVMRPAYAIEYDCVNPLALRPTLEFRDRAGLFGAGQFNGSSGYEEAAAQGLMAGINAAHKILGREEFTLGRHEAYIGILIDDLVNKGTNEPYRMMTSRAEYRLLLRHDTADRRLTPHGHKLGLIDNTRFAQYEAKQAQIQQEKQRLASVRITWQGKSATLTELLRRPELDYTALAEHDPDRPNLPQEVITNIETDIKYEGYLKRQQAQVHEMLRLEHVPLPADIDYHAITALRIEARQKLVAARPETLGAASRISGVNPADVEILLLFLKKK